MVVLRRTYHCKLGHAGPVVEILKLMVPITHAADGDVRAIRIYTDLSGATDRVITEMEREAFIHPRELSRRFHGHPEALALIGQMSEHLNSAEIEFLAVEYRD